MPNPPPRRRDRVRPVSRELGQSRIRNLRCYQEVYDRIIEGWPLTEVAKFIQEIKEESTDVARSSLVSALQDFRATIPPAELTKRRISGVYVDAVKKVEEGLDELRELEKLYKLQMGRIEIDVENEKKIKKLLPTTGQEVRIAGEILTKYADLKMDLGLSKRHLGQVDVDARLAADVAVRYNKQEVQEVLNNAQSRKKVLGLVERLLSKSAASLVSTIPDSGAQTVPALPSSDEELLEGNLLGEEDDLDPITSPIDLPPELVEAIPQDEDDEENEL